ncbi:MAG TPA: hypothetical protein VFG04_12980 [Planctomycetaceae bacterium]|jgi:hypothetical protein|nr:hypothetical protein [Planctomycetaceae bacterium]
MISKQHDTHRLTDWSVVPTLLLVVISLLPRAVADSSAAPQKDSTIEARQALRAMAEARGRFSSGVATIQGHKLTKRAFPGAKKVQAETVDATLRGLYAFDDARHLLRYDNNEPFFTRSISAETLRGKDSAAMRAAVEGIVPVPWDTKLRYVRNKDYSASWREDGANSRSSVNVQWPDSSRGGLVESRHHLFDLRSCGVIDYRQFQSGAPAHGEKIEEVFNRLSQHTIQAVRKNDDIVTLSLVSEEATHRLAIDTKNGFTAVEYIVELRHDRAVSKSRVTWKQAGNVWVPKTFSIEFDAPRAGRYSRYDFEFTWNHVNELVDRSYFDYKSFTDVWDDVVVVDGRRPDFPRLGVWKNGHCVEGDQR